MKKSLRIICPALVVLLTLVCVRLSAVFPLTTQPYVEKKYSGWSGVLQAWVCTQWNPGGSFVSWLNSCAASFEKSHEGVYLEFIPVETNVVRNIMDSGIRLPDIIIFSPGVLLNPGILNDIGNQNYIRSDLRLYGSSKALPIALSGYVWAYNRSLCTSPPHTADDTSSLTLPVDSSGRCFSAALLGLLSGKPGDREIENASPESGIDLGLPVIADTAALFSEDALDMFINGDQPALPVGPQEISRLRRLQENGRGPDWALMATGNIACTDQLLMAGLPMQNDESCSERLSLAKDFLLSLLDDDVQEKLADIGACSVTGKRIYPDFSDYAELDVLLNSCRLWMPDCFSEYSASDAEPIVRAFLEGKFPAEQALHSLGFESM